MAAVVLLLLGTYGVVIAQAPVDEGFEGAATSWKFADADAPYRIDAHQRTSQGARRGAGCELVRINAGAGSFVYLALDVPPAPVIAELRPSIWVRSSRPGIQLLARVVFPRTADDKGQPLTRLVRSAKSTQPGVWEQLRIDDLPRQVEAVVRPMRRQYNSNIDVREKYVDRLLLNVYGGQGNTEVLLDDLDFPSLVAVDPRAIKGVGQGTTAVGPARRRVELAGSVLMVDGQPFFPRIVEYQKESLSFLKELGFNVVKLAMPPPEPLLDEARAAGVWLICPPPKIEQPDDDSDPIAFDRRYEPVLAWWLGDGLTTRELESMREWVEQIRRADEVVNRPLVCDPADDLGQYARLLGSEGVLMLHRSVLGTTFELADFSTWLRSRPRLGMPGMPVWATIETQYSKDICEQISLLSAGRAPEPVADFEQIRLLVQAALSAGVRGLSFTSRSPLDAQDPATRVRATILTLVNLELKLIHEWIAEGTIDTTISATTNTTNGIGQNPGIAGATLQVKHTRLLLPYWAGTGAQYVPDQLAGNLITFVVKGAPDDNSVYELTVGGLRSLDSKRLVGGVHVKQNEFGVSSMILITDQLAVGATTARLWSAGERAARLQFNLAAHKLNYVREVDRQLARLADRVLNAPRFFELARKDLDDAKSNLDSHDWLATCHAAQRAMRPLRLIERSHWEKAVASIGSPAASPLVASFGEVPYHWLLARDLEGLSHSRNLIRHGDFESVQDSWEAGWRLYMHSQQAITMTPCHIEPSEHHSGKSSLHLSVKPIDADEPPSLIETPPLWVTSPSVPAEAGQWFRIRGCVKVPKAIEASLDGLMIIDTLGREPLADRIGKTDGWKEFTLYRAAPVSGPWSLTIALTGIGDAWIDDVIIEALYSPAPTRALSRTGRNLQPTQDKR